MVDLVKPFKLEAHHPVDCLAKQTNAQARFVAVEPDIIAGVLASTGDLSDAVAHDAESPLNEFGQLKSEIGGAP